MLVDCQCCRQLNTALHEQSYSQGHLAVAITYATLCKTYGTRAFSAVGRLVVTSTARTSDGDRAGHKWLARVIMTTCVARL